MRRGCTVKQKKPASHSLAIICSTLICTCVNKRPQEPTKHFFKGSLNFILKMLQLFLRYQARDENRGLLYTPCPVPATYPTTYTKKIHDDQKLWYLQLIMSSLNIIFMYTIVDGWLWRNKYVIWFDIFSSVSAALNKNFWPLKPHHTAQNNGSRKCYVDTANILFFT